MKTLSLRENSSCRNPSKCGTPKPYKVSHLGLWLPFPGGFSLLWTRSSSSQSVALWSLAAVRCGCLFLKWPTPGQGLLVTCQPPGAPSSTSRSPSAAAQASTTLPSPRAAGSGHKHAHLRRGHAGRLGRRFWFLPFELSPPRSLPTSC